MFGRVDRQLQMSQPEEKRPVDGAEVDAELPPPNSPCGGLDWQTMFFFHLLSIFLSIAININSHWIGAL